MFSVFPDEKLFRLSPVFHTIFEAGDIIHSHPDIVRADVLPLAHDPSQEVPTYARRRPP